MKRVEWIVIHMAHTEAEAQRLTRQLADEGFLIRVRQRAQMGVWELLATELESVPARDFLMENLHEQE